jgi:asparagine synthase (glutamine-hydrolysing)
MDNDLVDFAMRCPVNLKLNNLAEVVRINENDPGRYKNHFKKTKDGKQILRDVMKKYIPDDIAQAEKQGFSSPDASWFKGESVDFVKKKLMNGNASIYQWMDRHTVQKLLNEHISGENNRRLLVWSLLNFEEWVSKSL